MYDTFKTGDPSRLGAQVISGIGFLGAGSIITSGKTKGEKYEQKTRKP